MLKFEGKKTGFKVKLGKSIVRILPILVADPDLSEEQITLIKFFQELRFVPFGDKREKYMSQVGERLMAVLSK